VPLDWREADVQGGLWLSRASIDEAPAQRHPVRMVVDALVLADLPVDVVVVLEQQERARQVQRTEGALRKR
jgi:hypothetical protein